MITIMEEIITIEGAHKSVLVIMVVTTRIWNKLGLAGY